MRTVSSSPAKLGVGADAVQAGDRVLGRDLRVAARSGALPRSETTSSSARPS